MCSRTEGNQLLTIQVKISPSPPLSLCMFTHITFFNPYARSPHLIPEWLDIGCNACLSAHFLYAYE